MRHVEATSAGIRTFKLRRGRVSGRHTDALSRLWPAYGVPVPSTPATPAARALPATPALPAVPPAPIDPALLFGRRAPLILEIGSGMGELTATMAAADPARDYLAVEVHTPGVANLLALIEDLALSNVRVAAGDALELIHRLPPASLDAIHAFFPDPWPKARHRKRRLIQPKHVAVLRTRLVAGGTVHCATDWAEYAEDMLATLTADPELSNAFDEYAPRPTHRPQTKFELRGLDAGREIFDLIFTRRPDDARTDAQSHAGKQSVNSF